MPLIINGEPVEDSVIRREATALRPRFQEMMDGMDPVEMEMQLWDWSRENVIERVLLRQEALKDPDPIPPEAIDEALKATETQSSAQAGCDLPANDDGLRIEIETRLRVERLVGKVTGKLSPPRNKDLSDYYRKNKDGFWAAEMVHAGHIVKNVDEDTDEQTALEAIRSVRQELNNGANFEELADRYSDCPGNGGDLGYFPRGQMVQEFDDVIFSLGVNEVSDVFRTVFGWHIAKVYDKKPPGIRSFDEVRDDIAATLYREKQERAVESYLDRLKARADIQTVRGRGVTSQQS
jgi:parvulin-like peptidyl-prolyl isomerase